MSDLTHVELLWHEKRIENRIRFGRSVEEKSSTATGASCHSQPAASSLSFAGYRTILERPFPASTSCGRWQPADAARLSLMSNPAARILLRLSGWPKVERVLQLIDAVEALGIDPADAAPDYWHHVHNRLSVNEIPRAYTKSRHQAWLHRRKVAP